MHISRAIPVTLALALALVGCTTTLPGGATPTVSMGVPAIHMGERPAILFVGGPQQVIGTERPDIVLDGWN